MAILEAQPRIQVTIRSNGTDFAEYIDENDQADGPLSEKTVVRYIEIAPDVPFSIRTSVSKGCTFNSSYIVFHVYIDGVWTSGSLCPDMSLAGTNWVWDINHRGSLDERGNYCTSAFNFREIEIVEDTNSAKTKEDMKRISKIGVIKVEVFRAKRMAKAQRALLQKNADLKLTEVSEKASKGRGITHGVCGEATRSNDPEPSYVQTDYIDGKDKPLAVFLFKYRSKNILQSMGLIPRTPTPDPYDQLTAEEREKIVRNTLARERDNQRNANSDVKSERRAIKREFGIDENESIDLTRPKKIFKMIQGQDGKAILDLIDD